MAPRNQGHSLSVQYNNLSVTHSDTASYPPAHDHPGDNKLSQIGVIPNLYFSLYWLT